jgi:hypothetical protein
MGAGNITQAPNLLTNANEEAVVTSALQAQEQEMT